VVVVELVDVLVEGVDVVVEVEVRSTVVEGAAAASREPDEPEQATTTLATVRLASKVAVRRGVIGFTPPFWPKFRPGGRV